MSVDSNRSQPAVFTRLQASDDAAGAVHEVLTPDFLRKYVIFARRRYSRADVKMAITDDATDAISNYYTELRVQSRARCVCVSVVGGRAHATTCTSGWGDGERCMQLTRQSESIHSRPGLRGPSASLPALVTRTATFCLSPPRACP